MPMERSTSKTLLTQHQIHKRSKSTLNANVKRTIPHIGKSPQKVLRSISKPTQIKLKQPKAATRPIRNNGEANSLDDEVYLKDTFIAFVDKDAVENGIEQISIGKVSIDNLILYQVLKSTKETNEICLNLFEPEAKQNQVLNFIKVEGEFMIKEYQVLNEIQIEKETQTNVTINKQTSMRINKQFKKLFNSIRDQINADIDIEAQNISSSNEDEGDSDDESLQILREKRPVLKGKRTMHQTQVVKKSDSLIQQSKKSKIKQEKSTIVQIDQSSKANEEIQEIKPQIGKKRTYNAINKSISISQTTRKVKKLDQEGNQQVSIVKVKKPKAVKTVATFKLGKWNTETVVLQPNEEIEFNDPQDTPIYKCCTRCNSRNLVRAVNTNNLNLLITCLESKDLIPYVCASWSEDALHLNPIQMIIKKNDLDQFKQFYHTPTEVEIDTKSNQYQIEQQRLRALQKFVTNRVTVRQPLLTKINTGSVSVRAYGTEIRQVQMTRGNRQGNQAFVMSDIQRDDIMNLDQRNYFKTYVTPEIYELWRNLTKNLSDLRSNLYQYALAGNIEMLKWALDKRDDHDKFGYNKLHLEAFYNNQLFEKYHTATIIQQAGYNGLTPLQIACLNPSKDVLATLLEQHNEVNLSDNQKNSLMHFAALCQSPEPLLLLIQLGANVLAENTAKDTPLHFATKCKRIENVKAIIQNNSSALKKRNYSNNTPFVLACELGDIELIKTYLDFSNGVIKINAGQGIDRMTPLMYASAQGNYDLALFLLERKARVTSKDKFKRSALIMAVKNGHARLASLLLSRGSDWQHVDSSNNTAMHYAAANGFIECIELLIKHKADVNAVNMWKVTPITIAMLNNHFGTVKRLLLEESVDVNGKDDQGHSLLSIAVQNLEEPNCIEFIQYLINKGADINLQDLQMQTPLHILAAYRPVIDNQQTSQDQLYQKQQLLKTQFDLIDLLLNNGANLSAKNNSGLTPFDIALSCNNIEVLQKFILNVKLNENPNLLHTFKQNIFDERFRTILIQLMNQENNLTTETMNFQDNNGFTPFLQYIKTYVDCVKAQTFNQQIITIIRWNAQYYGQDFSKYKVSNRLLFDQTQIKTDPVFNQIHIENKLSVESEKALIKKYFAQLITNPFIEFMDFIISKGANPHQKVGKTQYYRNLDQQEKKAELDNLLQEQSQIVVDQNEFKKQYNQDFGLQNAVHLLLRHPTHKLYQFLVEKLNLAVDDLDILGRNPFIIFVASQPNRLKFGKTVTKLLQKNIQFDIIDQYNRTPFLIYYESQNHVLANQLLDLGANINQMDKGGMFPLKYALVRQKGFDEIRRLVNRGANINLQDTKGRNLLHHAVNMSSATADASFETEQMLIDLEINLNVRDNKGRVPLHYAFVKINNWQQYSQIDPIETVSSLCGRPGLEIEVADKWHKTPLHYAAQRGATICTLYILQRGANIESRDIYNNTALGIALLRKHFDYAILLIQKNANVCLPVYDEQPQVIAKQWQVELLLQSQMQRTVEQKVIQIRDVEMQSKSASSSQSETFEVDQDLEEEYDFGQTQFTQNYFQPQKLQQQHFQQPKSTFRHAIQSQKQGLAYLILDNKYDYMLAMEDALDEKKFNLVLTLLSKTADNRIVQKKNEQNQNLLHILAKNSNGGQFQILKRIYDELKKRGVDCFESDNQNNNALHYAVMQNCYDLCEILINDGININQINNEAQSPFSLFINGRVGANLELKDFSKIENQQNNLFYLLAKNGADINLIYPEVSYNNKDYQCNYLINMVRRSSLKTEQLLLNLKYLLQFKASLECFDSRGQDLMMYAIKHNNKQLVQFLVDNSDESAKLFFKQHRDHKGKNAIHYVVNPLIFGSFENLKLLQILLQSNIKYDLFAVDHLQKTPLDYACLQKSGVLAKALSNQMFSSTDFHYQGINYLPLNKWPEQQNDFEQDSLLLLQEAEAEKVKEIVIECKDYVPLDIAFANEKQYSVYYEGEAENRRPFDAYMTKVDLMKGNYGDYTFYKMQMVFDSNRELFIVLTRYGRIGENGINQRTPFFTFEEAKKEFINIFKQKSANDWETALNNFVEQPGKYLLINVDYTYVKHKDMLVGFDYKNCAKTKIKQSVRALISEISNYTMYQRSISEMGIDQLQLPLSNLQKDKILQANSILSGIKQALVDFDQIRQKQLTLDPENKTESALLYEQLKQQQIKIVEQSTAFYKLIPMKESYYWTIEPINHRTLLKLQEQMDSLLNIEFSTKILLGALYKQYVVHPCDYLLDIFQTQIDHMNEQDPEYKLIASFINNTKNQGQKIQFELFRVQKKGEGENYEKYFEIGNRRLLFHGTKLSNMIGILTQGLRIAPPEAPTTGYMFGKGIYFADTFKKSQNYCGGEYTKIMMLCEVALGNTMDLYKQFYVNKLPDGYNSTRAIGRIGPNYKQAIITPQGFKIPFGSEIQQKAPTEAQLISTIQVSGDIQQDLSQYFNHYYKTFNWMLQNNEYIVYNTDQVKIRYIIKWKGY